MHSVRQRYRHRRKQLSPRPKSEFPSSLESLNRQVMQQAIRSLSGVLDDPGSTRPMAQGSPLVAALDAIAQSLGLPLRLPAPDVLKQTPDPVAAIARSAQLRLRPVRLTEGWWQTAAEPMLAYRTSDQSPVALLPTPQGYVLFDPHLPGPIPVNGAIAADLMPQASAFYRTLPVTVKSLDLLKFGIQGYEKDLLQILGFGAIATLLGIVPAQLTAVLVNQAIPSGDRLFLLQMGGLLLAIAFGQLLFQIAQSILVVRVESATDSALQSALWDRLLRLSPGFFRQYTSGDLVKRVLSVRQMHQQLSGATQRSLLSGVFALLNLGLMVVYSPSLALIGVGIALVVAIGTVGISRMALRLFRAQAQLNGAIYGLVVQFIHGVSKLRVAMAEERAFAAWAEPYRQQLQLKARLQQMSDWVSTVNEILPWASAILLFGLAVPQLQAGQLNLGTFLAFNIAFGVFIQGVIDLSNTLTDLVDIVPLWERLQPILKAPLEAANKLPPGPLTGHLALEQVSFRYEEQSPMVLKGVSLYAEPGEFVAVVGPSGSGKSTLLRLLLGFETPTSGMVTYDNQDVAGLDLQALRRGLGVVLQHGQMGTGTMFEAITAGALASLEDAWSAARLAGLADDIEQMPMGMHTVLSEGGRNLSGGQRQRLLIARALVSQPKVLLMDEATSALDNRTQAIVAQNLEKLKVTRIIIAHRLSTIRNADRIYVMNAGQVEQVGTFAELMSQDGLFTRLAARQLEES